MDAEETRSFGVPRDASTAAVTLSRRSSSSTAAPDAPSPPPPPPEPPKPSKIKLHFKAVGNAPIMRKMKFHISGDEPFRSVHRFLRDRRGAGAAPAADDRRARRLQLSSDRQLFLYCDSAFTPSPVEPLDHLFRCFGAGGELVVNYATTGAYG
ncbi:hypothetical protein JL720_168 [Aureococcus anophagefferens]|nr:hypothetical protein JL720_168 [Aureococcus anophagefferens]